MVLSRRINGYNLIAQTFNICACLISHYIRSIDTLNPQSIVQALHEGVIGNRSTQLINKHILFKCIRIWEMQTRLYYIIQDFVIIGSSAQPQRMQLLCT